jgi:hypothetical protein
MSLIAKDETADPAYWSDVLWALVNSAEFCLNH